MSYKKQKIILLSTFLFFPITLMVLFMVVPSLRMLFYSFTDWDGVMKNYNFIGLKNYFKVFQEPMMWRSMKNNLVYAISGIIQNMIGLILAALICSRVKMKAQGLYKTILFLPYIINITAVAYMFNYVYDFREGPINLLLKALGGDPIRFLSDEKMVIYSLVFISFWKWLGFTMLLYIAAINSISAEIYEASEVDGASSWQSFLHVTLPNIVKILELQMFLAMSGALQAFVEPFVMTKGGPDNASSTFLFYIINIYTKYNDYGFAAALSVILILMILLITVIQRGAILGRRRHE